MLKQYNAVLRSLDGSARRKRQADREWDILYAELKELERKYDTLKAECVRKEDECNSIDFGWSAIVYGLRGQRKAELERARTEAKEMEGQLKEMDNRVGRIRRAMEALEQEKELLAPSAAEFKRKLAMKYQAMRQGGLLSAEIIHREEQKQRVQKELERIKGLWETSDRIMDQLRRISNHLNEAENAGQSDLLGGRSSGYSKHWHLADAQSEYDHLQKMIEEFGRQMNGETAHICDIAMEMDTFDREMDVLFDNIFVDWKILQRVRATKAEFMKVYDQMRIVRKSLMQRRNKLREVMERLKEEIDELVLAAE